MLPSAVVIDRPRPVQCFGPVIQTSKMVSLAHTRIQLRIAPAFVLWRPGYDARMVDIPSHHFNPLLVESVSHLVAKAMARSHLTPHQEPKPVRPVHERGVLNFLVFATPVETHGLAQFDVLPSRFECWWSHESSGPVALGEKEGLDVRLAVEPERAITCCPA